MRQIKWAVTVTASKPGMEEQEITTSTYAYSEDEARRALISTGWVNGEYRILTIKDIRRADHVTA
jgi:hypothetical protein